MDPIAHTFTGAVLAATGLHRCTPLATAALVLGANAPDVDVLAYFAGRYEALAFRRGWTHGILALAAWPFLLAGLLTLFDRCARLRRPGTRPARAGPLLALCALAVATHPTLDWLNNYGMRWLMPFDGQWSYGDALFIVDLWLWLGLGGVLFLKHSRAKPSLICWSAFWLFATYLVLASNERIPQAAQAVWLAGLTAFVAARALGFAAPAREAALERTARIAVGCTAFYIAALLAAGVEARAAVRTALLAEGIDAVEVMVAPMPANPFAGDVVAATSDAYHVGRWRWLSEPRFERVERIARAPEDPVFRAAAAAADARRFLAWSRFPYVEVEAAPDGERTVQFLDARYRRRGGLHGPTIRLAPDLRPVAAHE